MTTPRGWQAKEKLRLPVETESKAKEKLRHRRIKTLATGEDFPLRKNLRPATTRPLISLSNKSLQQVPLLPRTRRTQNPAPHHHRRRRRGPRRGTKIEKRPRLSSATVCPTPPTTSATRSSTWCTQKPLSVAARSGSSPPTSRSEEHTSELQSRGQIVCRLLLE